MMKPEKSPLEEEVYDDKVLHASIYDSSLNDGMGTGKQSATPRSKHSATEQRRRSKINERFQILRDLIPRNDQKRDKASILLEVIEYIQFLQEKINMYEGSFQAWGQEPTKLMPWRNNHGPLETYVDQSQAVANGSAQENSVVTPIITNAQNLLESDLSLDSAYRAADHSHGLASQKFPLNMQSQPNVFSSSERGGIPVHPSKGYSSDAEHIVSPGHCQLDDDKRSGTEYPVSSNVQQEQEFADENKMTSISSAYSQGVLHNLTQALQSSGVDMSKASISVQIDVGKQTHGGRKATENGMQDNKHRSPCDHPVAHYLVSDESDQAFKRMRRGNS